MFFLPREREKEKERRCSSLTLFGLRLSKLYFRRIRLKRALACFCISFLLNVYYTFMDSKIECGSILKSTVSFIEFVQSDFHCNFH